MNRLVACIEEIRGRLDDLGLRVWLYLDFHQLPDPPSFARDVAHVGHWGGGDLEPGISTMDQVQAARPLIRASFDARCNRK
jgi:predicted transport protein